MKLNFSPVAIILATCIGLAACSDDDNGNSGGIPVAQTKILLDIIEETDELDSLENLVVNNPMLLNWLLSEDSINTLFAPSNAAFRNFYSDNYFEDFTKQDLEKILLNHILPRVKIPSSELEEGLYQSRYKNPSTGIIEMVEVNADNTIESNTTNGSIAIADFDKSAVNGLIHIVDNFIVPKNYKNDGIDTLLGDKVISTIVQETAGLDSLKKYIVNYNDLIALLSDTSQIFTFFAPDNPAFIALLATPGFPNNIASINPDLIKGVLEYHVVVGQKITSADLVGGTEFETAYSDPLTNTPEVIKVNANGTLLTGSTNTELSIKTFDIPAKNGVVHIVESVMIPPSIGILIYPLLGTIAGAIYFDPEFTELLSVINIADSNVPTGMLSIKDILSSIDFNYTFLAPPNAVLNAVDLSQLDAASARALLLDHIVPGITLSSSISDGLVVTALSGKNLIFQVTGGLRVGINIGAQTTYSPIILPDITSNIANGAIHIIGGLIL